MLARPTAFLYYITILLAFPVTFFKATLQVKLDIGSYHKFLKL